ncbi:hypothetical protein COU97_00705 [Candidatus Shapirobacteria bacterium CG10_big_fil_rev_8_21_14_0_10_48_15]|uniref:Peptidase C39-like domain-containing protein n=1 Tax=Candidatus Shapirobacteria bacterium CG10_big_fil_rev_8_21_14_0_10_48_15 TaxID=1974484 RepID=A0A2M8L7L1_9BACT|nr:MAG: hypothetical protein COU97_00705 [Candidatus Shapirobacteria bacterium CG10_big_fil_rev_8_21_14_0_10_48_15]
MGQWFNPQYIISSMKKKSLLFFGLAFALLVALGVIAKSSKPAPSPIRPNNSPAPIATSSPWPATKKVLLDVPFTPQAPLAEWDDPLQQDGCEEAAALMAVAWARGQKLGSHQASKDKILEIAHWQETNYGNGHDTAAADTVTRIFQGFFGYHQAEAKVIHDPQAIIEALLAGRLVVTPMDGQKIGNPYYTQPGPERHMIVIRGWDPQKQQLITNDPGTRRGEGFAYDLQKFWDAIRDYPTGDHVPITGINKVMIVVTKEN